MSKKRSSDECSNEERITESSSHAGAFQQMDNSKRGKLSSVSDTMLQDLPREMMERILIEAISLEVKDLKLAKTAWKDKADPVVDRLKTVCSHWNDILTTNSFRIELHRTLDVTAQETILLEVLHQSLIHPFIVEVTAMKDEIWIHCLNIAEDRSRYFDIKIYDRNNLAEVKDVIELSKRGVRAAYLAACNLSNRLYVQHQNREYCTSSIIHITRDPEIQFKLEMLIDDLPFSIASLSVSFNGNVLIVSTPEEVDCEAVSIYDPNGDLHQQVVLSPDIYGFSYVHNVIQKSNGNLIIDSVDEQFQPSVTEINTDGGIERRYKSPLWKKGRLTVADSFGRIAINDLKNGMQLLDSELNPLDFTCPKSDQGDFDVRSRMHYNSERNETVGFRFVDNGNSVLTIFRFAEQ